MEKRFVWGGWRKRYLLAGDTILANIMRIGHGRVIVNEQVWGRGRLEPTYRTIGEAKKAAEVWARHRAVQKAGAA